MEEQKKCPFRSGNKQRDFFVRGIAIIALLAAVIAILYYLTAMP